MTTAKAADTSRWGRIPAWWLDHPDLDADGFAVLAALATFADEHGLCWPSQSTLAAKLKRSRPTINRILQTLDRIGLVSIEHRSGRDGARLSCLYRLRLVRDGGTDAVQAAPTAVPTPDRDDSRANAPCPTASQEHHHSEQTPDSHASGRRGPVLAVLRDWMPSADDLAWAHERFGAIDLVQHVETFTLRCQAHGYRYRDIGAAWRAWLMQDAAAGRAPSAMAAAGRTARPAQPFTKRAYDNAAEQRMGAWMAAAARLQGSVSPSPTWS
ncbi:helix-turn-helix domain-containing protein [Azospirillum sp. RWY-5-1]|uniref:Helix-turn-helix domain-containing protein n=1 Tax=Azospirillum oleiclasticum TaxID=2735135 RepID=A0ABX2T949_9PROT|nr:helix-turn-helix domain-containing protein [Azospirillum oleiclasticum]NYZ13925.1 helix-turn-helix domain-containing protein [Azospirillum oleiclasticum]NYZ20849.1 helix-turn-helix domain-containing protein [Azospirillum oleiclasticum]